MHSQILLVQMAQVSYIYIYIYITQHHYIVLCAELRIGSKDMAIMDNIIERDKHDEYTTEWNYQHANPTN